METMISDHKKKKNCHAALDKTLIQRFIGSINSTGDLTKV